MRASRLIPMAILAALMPGLGASSWISAATVELHVIDERDQPVGSTGVGLRKIESTGNRSYFRIREVTDPGGRVVFNAIEPGRYAVHVFGERGHFVSLPNHPEIQQHLITVESDNDRLGSTVRVVRGTPVVFRVSVGGQELPGARVLLHDLDREYWTDISMRERVEREVRLVAGRWTARVDPVPGYLLTSVEVNRTILANDVAEFDLPLGTQAWYVNFEFAAQAHIWGKVIFEGDTFGVRIVSHLQEAGPWLPAVQARGGSQYETVWTHPVHPNWEYEMVVPEGRWLVRPEAPGLERADPPELEVQLQAGDYERIDFVVAGHGRGGGKWTYVRVEDTEHKRVPNAVVEAWPANPDARDEAPVATAKTRGWSDAILRGLGDDEYLFVAGKPGYVEASTIAKPPDPTERRRVRLRLGPGATVHAVARDEDGEAAVGVEVVLTREDDYVSQLADREIAEWAARPSAATDGTAHLWMRGVYPGRYRLTGTLEGKDATMFFAEFRNKGDIRWEREMKKEYRGAETDQIEIRLAPAGVLRATVHCSDGSDLPPEADILVLDGLRAHEPEAWWEEAVHKTKAYVLEGDRRDGFHVGPLDRGAYHLLVRPQEHNRWTWALGTESPEEATVLSVVAGEPTDLGAIAIDCAPAVSVRPVAPEGVELPDLVATGIHDPLAELAGTLTIDGEQRELDRARLIAEPARVQFRDLPEGDVDLTVTVWNPFFLPGPALSVPIKTTLERGRTVEVSPRLEGIGGAIEIDVSQLQQPEVTIGAIRVVPLSDASADEPAKPWIVEVIGSLVLIPSLPSGVYNFDLCFDTECTDWLAFWQEVDIAAGVLVNSQAQSVSAVGVSARESGRKMAHNRPTARIEGTSNAARAGKTLAKPVRLLTQPPSTPPTDPAPKVIRK